MEKRSFGNLFINKLQLNLHNTIYLYIFVLFKQEQQNKQAAYGAREIEYSVE